MIDRRMKIAVHKKHCIGSLNKIVQSFLYMSFNISNYLFEV